MCPSLVDFMIPILYEETETAFTTNGIGRLSDTISCKVTEERNGIYELEMVYPVTGQHFADIQKYMLIYATHEDEKGPQPFEIYRITRPLNGKVTVYAHHISYRLNKMVTTGDDVAASPTACASALNTLITGAILPTGQTFDFTFETDVTTAASFKASVPRSVRSRLLGSEGSILDQFGGEYEWDKFKVVLHAARGADNGVTIRYGKNLTDIEQDLNIENTVTGVIPFWQGDNNVVTGTIQYSRYAPSFNRQRIVSVDFTESFENQPTVEQLNTRALEYANDHGEPDVSINVSFVDLAKTEEYKDILPLTHVHLCDTVTVQYEELGINRTAKIAKVVYDVLADKYESIIVGNLTQSFARTITDNISGEIATVAVKMSNSIANATAWLKSANGWVMAVTDSDGRWKELVFSDRPDPYDDHAKILRINNNGMGFSTSGMNGTFTNAWTIDGNLVADFMTTGVIRSKTGNNSWNLDTGVLTIAGSNLSGSIDGNNVNITNISGGNIKTGTITATQIASGTITATEIQSNSVSTDRLQTSEIGDLGSGVYFSSNIGVGGRVGTQGLRCSGDARFTGDEIEISVSAINVNTGTPGWKEADSRYVEGVGSFVHGLLVSNGNIWD